MTYRLVALALVVLVLSLVSATRIEARVSRFTADLDATDFAVRGIELAPRTPSAATGTCELTSLQEKSAVLFHCEHTVGDATVARIHSGLPGERGPALLTVKTAAGLVSAEWHPNSGALRQLEVGALYVTIASTEFPDGEIRGQLAPEGRRGEVLSSIPSSALRKSASCGGDVETLCLGGGRLRLSVRSLAPGDSVRSAGQAVADSASFGRFWLEDQASPELTVKLLNDCDKNGHLGLEVTPSKALDFELTVADTETGTIKRYRNSPGEASAILDEEFLPCAIEVKP